MRSKCFPERVLWTQLNKEPDCQVEGGRWLLDTVFQARVSQQGEDQYLCFLQSTPESGMKVLGCGLRSSDGKELKLGPVLCFTYNISNPELVAFLFPFSLQSTFLCDFDDERRPRRSRQPFVPCCEVHMTMAS